MVMSAKTNAQPKQKQGMASVPEVAEYLKLSRSTVYRAINAGEIKSTILGTARRINWSDVYALSRSHGASK